MHPRGRNPKPIEEYEDVDENANPGRGKQILNFFIGSGSSPKPSSYDILAKTCGSSQSDLKKSATILRLTSNCKMYDNIKEYVKNSRGEKGLRVKTIYKIERNGEKSGLPDKFKLLLWHGTVPSAVPGIIHTGFKPGSRGLFGGAMYFADRISKSASYVQPSVNGTAFFILAEVAPGKVYKAHHFHANYTTAPQGFDTVKGMGSQIPDWKQNKDYKGAILPVGNTVENMRHKQYDMPFNEYIVYDKNRVIVRFVVECTL